MWAPDVQFDEAGVLRSNAHQDVYFSPSHGLEEVKHVFISGTELRARLASGDGRQGRHSILEVGFGTSLNFLAVWHTWRQARAAASGPIAPMEYVSVEAAPLTRAQVRTALARFPELQPLLNELCPRLPPPARGVHRISLEGGQVLLTLLHGEAEDALAELDPPPAGFDTVFLDGFAPSRNPGAWREQVLARMTSMCRGGEGGVRLATFTAAGAVRRALAAQGWRVAKRPGFGRKRDMVCASLESEPTVAAAAHPPWSGMRHPGSPPLSPGGSAVVVGGGVAGAAVAEALSRRGVHAKVLCGGEGASTNAAGIVSPRLSAEPTPGAELSIAAFLYTRGLLRDLGMLGDPSVWRAGLVRLASGRKGAEWMRRAAQASGLPPHWLSVLDGEAEVAAALGVPRAEAQRAGMDAALFQARAGAVRPAAFLDALFAAGEARGMVDRWQPPRPAMAAEVDERGGVSVLDGAGGVLATGDAVVWACGAGLPGLPGAASALPGLQLTRGQLVAVPAGALRPRQLAAVSHGDGYMISPFPGSPWAVLGATYSPAPLDDVVARLQAGTASLEAEVEAGVEQALIEAAPDALLRAVGATRPDRSAELAPRGRSALRLAAPDRMPVVGPSPAGRAELEKAFSWARHGPVPPSGWSPAGWMAPRSFTVGALGSHGLTWAPLAAEAVASAACGESMPVARRVAAHMAPARLAVRALKRRVW